MATRNPDKHAAFLEQVRARYRARATRKLDKHTANLKQKRARYRAAATRDPDKHVAHLEQMRTCTCRRRAAQTPVLQKKELATNVARNRRQHAAAVLPRTQREERCDGRVDEGPGGAAGKEPKEEVRV